VADSPHVCQYWSELEPAVCANWEGVCVFEGPNGERATFYPYCNMIGTSSTCDQYDAEGTQSRCILPDVSRHVVDRLSQDGTKWVTLPDRDEENNYVALEDSDYSRITKYNKDHCVFGEGDGTSNQCAAYSPYHLGFTTIQPDDKDSTLEYDEDGYTTGSGLTFRLPLGYEIFNERSTLSKCNWWEGSVEYFSVSSGTGQIEPILFKCDHPDTGYTKTFNTLRYNTVDRFYTPPCNGAKPECQYYTGVCWKYCIDEKMRQGDKVLAEQILELRWHLKRNRWDDVKFRRAFKDSKIYTWAGDLIYNYDASGTFINNWSIDSFRTEITDYDLFEVSATGERLTAGTQDQGGKPDYPTLVEALKELPLQPIIRNKFFKDPLDGSKYIFESASIDGSSILLVGDIFYNSPTYAINLSDPDLDILARDFRAPFVKQTGSDNPDDLIRAINDGTAEFEVGDKYYDSMAEIEAAYAIEEEFEEFYDRFDLAIERLLKYWPDKIFSSEVNSESLMFSIDVPLQWGENIILVLNKGSGRWEFDFMQLTNLFCGGVIAQRSFSLVGDDATIDYLPAYERDFNAYLNKNGSIEFSFETYGNARGPSATTSYVYNDYAFNIPYANPLNPPDQETYYLGYRLYKVKLDIPDVHILADYIRFFGNVGYAIVEIPDDERKLSCAFRDWDIEGSLNLHITTQYGEEKTIEMEIVEKCTARLEINQMIIKPKNLAEFTQPCDPYLSFTGVYYYEKRSFDETPDGEYELIDDDFVGDDTVVYRDTAVLTGALDYYNLTEFGSDPLIISVVYKGFITGHIKGVTRTKMLTWVKQPYCRDVEIYYAWARDYRNETLHPEEVCFGRTYPQKDPDLVTKGLAPPCGDHDLSVFTGKGPMWYPYDDCDETATYPTDQLTQRVTLLLNRPMEVFQPNEAGVIEHGSWDMRMLGPQDSEGYVCDTHASIFNCTCDWSYCNYKAETEQRFTGYGRFRGNMDDEAKLRALQFGGSLPKFGNPVRDFLRSYRSVDNTFYYIVNNGSYIRRQKWMPLYYFYTSADLVAGLGGSYPHELYSRDLESPFIHPMGLYLAEGNIEGVNIAEYIDVDEDDIPNRYYFDEIFDTHRTTSSLTYPYPTNAQYDGSNFLITWFTYKDHPTDSSKSIQWAWQEVWSDIERDIPETDIILGEDIGGFDSGEYSETGAIEVEEVGVEIEELVTSRPFAISGDLDYVGPFLFLDIEYPDYKYDAELAEHRLVAEEDDYVLTLTAPVRNSDGEYEDPKFKLMMSTALVDGPYRTFDIDGNWDPDDVDNTYYDLYTTCTTSPWVTDVTLFAPGYTDKTIAQAETDGRVISTYDSGGSEVKEYYQRGLNVSLDTDKFIYLPREKTIIEYSAQTVKFSDEPFLVSEDSKYASIISGETYAVEHCWEIGYSADQDEVDFTFNFTSKKAVDRVIIICKFGSEVLETDENDNPISWRLYHLPAVELARSNLGIIYDTMFSANQMVLADNNDNLVNRQMLIDYNLDGEDVLDTHSKWRLRLRVKPTSAEINNAGISGYYNDSENVVFIKCIYVYDTIFTDAKETISSYERLYNISYGNHGDFPPHGYQSTGSLLYPATHESSTLYQRDSIGGVVGLSNSDGQLKTMNKIRGRIMFECHEDKEPLSVNTVTGMEDEQKRIYDEIAIGEGSNNFTFEAVAPPGFEEKLSNANATYPALWTCRFTNSIVLPLTQVQQYDTYTALGNYWDWDFSDFHWEARCAGSQFGVFSVGPRQVFDYVLVSAFDDDLIWQPNDAIVVYYSTIGRVLVDAWTYLKNEFTGREEAQDRILDSTNDTYPDAIDPY